MKLRPALLSLTLSRSQVWDGWLAPYVGRLFSDPSVAVSRAHPERLRPPGAQQVVVAALSDAQLAAKLSAIGLDTSGSRAARVARLEAALRSDSVPY